MEPITRIEQYLAKAAGEYDGASPEPRTRKEYWLDKIVERIENGQITPEEIDAAIEAYLNSHDADIVTEQELADALADYYNKRDMDTALGGKVDKDGDKVLTDINYSSAEQEKVTAAYEARHTHNNKEALDGITAARMDAWDAAEVNVNADWESDSGDSQILHKPAHLVQDADYVHTDNNFTNACKDKLTGIEAGAQVNTVTGVKGSAENDYRTGNIELSKTDIGLGNVNNTADADKPISTATQTALDGKSDAGHTHDDRYYTESEIDVALADKAEASHSHDDRYYTETEMDAALGNKSNIGHTHDDRYYTEAETDALLDGKADAADIPDVSSFITRLVSDLANYYTKSETYTQTEINALVSAIPKFAIEVVSALPTEDISPTTVYLLTSQTQENGNLYTEYLYVGHSWELLGSQTVDLSGYYTKEQVDSLISGLPVAGHTHDDRYYTENEIDEKIQTLNTAIGGKAASDHQHDDRYYTESEVDTLLSGKANTGHTHDAATQSAAGFMSAADKMKLDGITAAKMAAWNAAEPNVQSNWNQTDTTADDYIKNKPANLVQDANYVHTDNNFTAAEKTKLDELCEGVEEIVFTVSENSQTGTNEVTLNIYPEPENLAGFWIELWDSIGTPGSAVTQFSRKFVLKDTRNAETAEEYIYTDLVNVSRLNGGFAMTFAGVKTVNGTSAVLCMVEGALGTDIESGNTLWGGFYNETEINQNAFANVKVGSTTVAADAKQDTLELVAGSNVTITPDATNDKITIAATDTVYTHPTSGVTAGTYGSATQVPKVTVDAQGHVTGVTATTITGVTPASHAHGNVTNAGAITAAGVALASGDALVFADASDSNKLKKTSITVGADTTTYLRNDGTWAAPPDTNKTLLYQSSSADGDTSFSAITLSDNVSNYAYIEVVTVDAGCFKSPVINGECRILPHRIHTHYPNGIQTLRVMTERWDISGTTLTRSVTAGGVFNQGRYLTSTTIINSSSASSIVTFKTANTSGGITASEMGIYRILGYK